MNVYFSCSITGGREDQQVYQRIVRALLEAGHEVPTAGLADVDTVGREAALSPEQVYARDIAWIDACDVVVAEVSTPSHGVGYEIAYALGLGKPVLCCCQAGRRVSKMLTGNSNRHIRVVRYEQVEAVVEAVLGWLREDGQRTRGR